MTTEINEEIGEALEEGEVHGECEEPEGATIEEVEENDEEELSLLKEEVPELASAQTLDEALNTERYRELRALGLTPREAYLATAKKRAPDTRAHLSDSYPRPARNPASAMTRGELCRARELFSELSDTEILRLYKKVTERQ